MADETTSYSQAYLNESRQPMLISIAILFMAASTTIVILRFVSRRIGEVGLHREDIFILLGWAFYMAFIGVAIGDVKYGGVGLHQARVVAIDPHMMVNWAKFLLAIVFIYSLSVIWPKFAILSLYISLFSIHRVSRIICYATGILIATNAAANVAAGFAICRPLDALWTGDIAEHCFNINAFFRYSRIVNIISDVAMLILPIPHIVRLQSRTRLKIGLVITFLSGSLGLISGLIALAKISTTNAVVDNTWSAALLILWSLIEVGMYLIAACLVSYLPLVKFLWRKVRGTEKLSSSDSHHLSTVGGGSSAHDRGLKPFKRHANGTESSWDIIEPVTVVGGSDSPDRERNPPGQIVLERQFIVE